MKRNVKVHFIEVIEDADLRKRERKVNETLERSHPGCAPVKLFRTTDGRIGFQIHLRVAAGDRRLLDEVYRVIMRALGERRGRPPGVKKVQVKLRLPQPVYSALKQAATDSGVTVSKIVADLAARELGGRRGASGAVS